ncbi:MAG: response regulator transcription factor [Clostridia bacterium]|nr:response regulator transcription factor [Clostridia bacterium]
MNERVLIVDDEKNIVDVIVYAMKREGFSTEQAFDGEGALEKVDRFNPQIVILDLMLPKLDGYTVCKMLQDKNIGIVMLTAKNDIVDKILGLELGADDYLTKPFDIRELTARVKSLARRFKKAACDKKIEIIEIGNLKIISASRSVLLNGLRLDFTTKEFDLLFLLASNRGRVYSRDDLLNLVWNMDYIGGTRTVDTHIQRIRRKLGTQYENIIETVHGVGYMAVWEY